MASRERPPHRDPSAALLAVGYVAGAHGVHGAVRMHLHDPASGALVPGREITLHRDDRPLGTHAVVRADPVPGKPGRLRVTLDGLAGRDAAEALRGCEVLVARNHLPALADDEFYLADAIGLPVVRRDDGQALGTIVGLTSNGAQDLFEVEHRGADGRAHAWLLPVLPGYVVDLRSDAVVVDLPLGLLPDALEREPS